MKDREPPRQPMYVGHEIGHDEFVQQFITQTIKLFRDVKTSLTTKHNAYKRIAQLFESGRALTVKDCKEIMTSYASLPAANVVTMFRNGNFSKDTGIAVAWERYKGMYIFRHANIAKEETNFNQVRIRREKALRHRGLLKDVDIDRIRVSNVNQLPLSSHQGVWGFFKDPSVKGSEDIKNGKKQGDVAPKKGSKKQNADLHSARTKSYVTSSSTSDKRQHPTPVNISTEPQVSTTSEKRISRVSAAAHREYYALSRINKNIETQALKAIARLLESGYALTLKDCQNLLVTYSPSSRIDIMSVITSGGFTRRTKTPVKYTIYNEVPIFVHGKLKEEDTDFVEVKAEIDGVQRVENKIIEEYPRKEIVIVERKDIRLKDKALKLKQLKAAIENSAHQLTLNELSEITGIKGETIRTWIQPFVWEGTIILRHGYKNKNYYEKNPDK